MTGRTHSRGSSAGAAIAPAALIAGIIAVGVGGAVFALLVEVPSPTTQSSCGSPSAVELGPPGTSQLVGASEYGGPGDPSSGVVGASGANLLSHPDSYAELGGD